MGALYDLLATEPN